MAFEVRPISVEKVQDDLARLRPEFGVLADYMIERAGGEPREDVDTGSLLAAPNLEIGSSAFEAVLFPPLENRQIDHFQKHWNRILPMPLRYFFRHANGGFFGDLSIYGIPVALDRDKRSPLDIGMGEVWRFSYASCDEEMVLFASRNVSDAGQIGYFLSQDGSVVGRGNGEPEAPAQAGQWESFGIWLAHQLSLNS